MNLTVLTPEQEIFNGKVRSVKVPAVGGQFEILAKHAPVVAALEKGKIRIINSKDEKTAYEIEHGFVEVLNDEVVVLVTGLTQLGIIN